MKNILYILLILFMTNQEYSQPRDIYVTWKCNMEIEILSGRFDPAAEVVSVRGDFNGWSVFDMIADPGDPNVYITPYPFLFPQLEVGDTVTFYKFFYTPNTWEFGDNKFYILTQEDYDNSAATISRSFNDLTINNVTNQQTIIQFFVNCNDAVSFLNGQPFPVINSCHIAGSPLPLQWPDAGWPDNQLYLMTTMYDDGTNGGDLTAGDKVFSAQVTFPAYTPITVQYKYSINYGDNLNNGGGNDNEAGYSDNHFIELSQYMISATVDNVFGTMGYHNLINIVIIPVELTSFRAQAEGNNIILDWITATETNNQCFEIEKKNCTSKADQWMKIGYVAGSGTTTEPRSYSFIDRDATPGRYAYRLKQIDLDGSFSYSDKIEIETGNPSEFVLKQNYPNPFNPGTKIKYSVPQTSQVQIKVFDVLGNEIETLINEEKLAGTYELTWNAVNLPSGVYFYQLRAGAFMQTKKMVILK